MNKQQLKDLISEIEEMRKEYIKIESECLSHYMKGYWRGKRAESLSIIEKLKTFLNINTQQHDTNIPNTI
jgi:hypothetical protein